MSLIIANCSSNGISLLNLRFFEIYISILSCLRISPWTPYAALHSLSIKKSLPHHKNIWFNYCIDSLMALLSYYLVYIRLGLIRTPEEFWAASLRSVMFVHLRRSPELYRDIRVILIVGMVAPNFYHNTWHLFFDVSKIILLSTNKDPIKIETMNWSNSNIDSTSKF